MVIVTYAANKDSSHLASCASFSDGRCHGLCRLSTIIILWSIRQLIGISTNKIESNVLLHSLIHNARQGVVVVFILALHEN